MSIATSTERRVLSDGEGKRRIDEAAFEYLLGAYGLAHAKARLDQFGVCNVTLLRYMSESEVDALALRPVERRAFDDMLKHSAAAGSRP